MYQIIHAKISRICSAKLKQTTCTDSWNFPLTYKTFSKFYQKTMKCTVTSCHTKQFLLDNTADPTVFMNSSCEVFPLSFTIYVFWELQNILIKIHINYIPVQKSLMFSHVTQMWIMFEQYMQFFIFQRRLCEINCEAFSNLKFSG